MEIQIEFLSSSILAPLGESERIDFILTSIKSDKIIVFDDRLSSKEQTDLITETMKRVTKKFPGIEISTLGVQDSEDLRSTLIRFLGGKTGGLTVIGPSRLVKQMRRDANKIRLLAQKK